MLSTKFKHIIYKLSKLYLLILLVEIFLGGAGRLVTIGPLTLRMYLFIGGMFITIILLLIGYKLSSLSKVIIFCFTVIYLSAILLGLFNNADVILLLADAKMASFFFIYPLFDLIIREELIVNRIIFLLKSASFLMATLYISTIFLLYSGIINFKELYDVLSKEEYSGEFGFRGGESGALIYKGFAYMCMGFFFHFFSKRSITNILLMILIIIAIVATLTRGFILTILIILLPYIIIRFIKDRKFIILFFSAILFCYVLLIAVPIFVETLGDKSESDLIRKTQIIEVADRISFSSILVGHGYGIGVPIREGHFEMTYLEIFHKQGIMGLFFWFGILGLVLKLYLKNRDNLLQYHGFFCSILFLYIQSASNPFLVNSIGLTMLFITITYFNNVLKNNESFSLHSDIQR